MTAFYNECDPYAAQWLRNLIAAGLIAPGVVDERKIQDIEAWELMEFTQCHFFAGIGVWSHALRRAGWPDDAPIWTGSCPCQPFSAAGKQKGFDDERHLWPTWFGLIEQCKPTIVIGEQVASALDWLDLVSVDMEGAGYAFGASDLCAAGFGGAHIRQRLYFVGMADTSKRSSERNSRSISGAQTEISRQDGTINGDSPERHSDGGANGGMADSHDTRSQGWGGMQQRAVEQSAGPRIVDGGLADSHEQGSGRRRILRSGEGAGEGEGAAQQRPAGLCTDGGMADAEFDQRGQVGALTGRGGSRSSTQGLDERPGNGVNERGADAPMLGRNLADWLYCRDGKWRPVEPGTFPLVDAASARVGRLRAYGNALDAETATQFCEAVAEIAGIRSVAEYDL